MKITILRNNEKIETLVEQDNVDDFVQTNIRPGEYFTVSVKDADGFYEREYRK